jgi:CelD/BcsL family acetyltransferase involved in cellulose biosynthesis
MSELRVELLSGAGARDALGDERFVEAWAALHSRSRHATAYQSPSFVRSWYSAYAAVYDPVIARGTLAGGGLAFLWLLAFEPRRAELVHAGVHQAEYHVWLAQPEHEAEALRAAWLQLGALLPFRALRFKYLPAAGLADVLRGIPEMAARMAVRIDRRPLMQLDAARIRASLAKKSNRSRMNRLRQLGNLDFRRLDGPAEMEQVFDDFIAFYDFRQAAGSQSAPFRDDPLKRGFHVALFGDAPHQTCFTVSLLCGRPIAAAWCATSGAQTHLGMIAHSPLLARHSPGKMHLLQLASHLLEDGKQVLDLTPGGDAWKARYATEYDVVAEVTIYRSRLTHVVAVTSQALRESSARWAARAGVRPVTMSRALKAFRRATPAAALRKLRGWVAVEREFRLYRLDRDRALRLKRSPQVAKNSLTDLLLFEPGESWQSRDAFLSDALKRLERGETVYSMRVDGRLAIYLWTVKNQRKSYMSEVQQYVQLPRGSVVIYDAYAHPDFRRRGMAPRLARHMLRDVFEDDEVECVYASVLSDNRPSRRAIEAFGQYVGSLHWRQRFGRISKWADSVLACDVADA